jgi:hypothetical protein
LQQIALRVSVRGFKFVIVSEAKQSRENSGGRNRIWTAELDCFVAEQ